MRLIVFLFFVAFSVMACGGNTTTVRELPDPITGNVCSWESGFLSSSLTVYFCEGGSINMARSRLQAFDYIREVPVTCTFYFTNTDSWADSFTCDREREAD